MGVSLIVAVAKNDVIGRQGTVLPWCMSADLKRFKKLTMGHPIIMGRKTFETIGRALPGRTNIIITSNEDYSAEDCLIADSLAKAFDFATNENATEVYVIGGGMISAEALPFANKLYLTEVDAEPEGDTFFKYDSNNWQEVERESHVADADNEFDYSFVTYQRK